MAKENEVRKVPEEMLSEKELDLIYRGISPWPDTKAPKRPVHNSLHSKRNSRVSSKRVAV